LPEELAGDQVALERFRREPRAASMADHPNICTIYEVGEYEGAPCIAMQLLQGRTLSARIDSAHHDPIQLNELLSIAIQVTSGLDAAHGSR
jgi:serine/threonine protein kinase